MFTFVELSESTYLAEIFVAYRSYDGESRKRRENHPKYDRETGLVY